MILINGEVKQTNTIKELNDIEWNKQELINKDIDFEFFCSVVTEEHWPMVNDNIFFLFFILG